MAQTNGKRKAVIVGGIQSWADSNHGCYPFGTREWKYEIAGFAWAKVGEYNYVKAEAMAYAASHNAEYIVLVSVPCEIV